MRIVKIEETTPEDLVETLRHGGIAVFPTDTVYGIIGDAINIEVIQKIFDIKKRLGDKALPIFVKDIQMARKYAYISDAKAKFLEKLWPGPVTVVFDHKEKLPGILTGGKTTIGMRVPDDSFLRTLLGLLKVPLVQTSANVSGRSPAQNIDEVLAFFGDKALLPDLIVDGGRIGGRQSTAIDFRGTRPILLRTGAVSLEKLEQILNYLQ